MLDRLDPAVWFDPNKTWLEPAAGDGNFLVEIKARLLQAGHNEAHVLENMLFSIELIDDNHWALQHRLGYLIDGAPNPALNADNFVISKISKLTQDLNDKNPYVAIGCERDEVLHHRNHVCASGLEYDMSFSRDESVATVLPLLQERELGEWPQTDTPDVGERYIVEKMLGTQPQLIVAEPIQETKEKSAKIPKPKAQKEAPVIVSDDNEIVETIRLLWKANDPFRSFTMPQAVAGRLGRKQTPELLAEIKRLISKHEGSL